MEYINIIKLLKSIAQELEDVGCDYDSYSQGDLERATAYAKQAAIAHIGQTISEHIELHSTPNTKWNSEKGFFQSTEKEETK